MADSAVAGTIAPWKVEITGGDLLNEVIPSINLLLKVSMSGDLSYDVSDVAVMCKDKVRPVVEARNNLVEQLAVLDEHKNYVPMKRQDREGQMVEIPGSITFSNQKEFEDKERAIFERVIIFENPPKFYKSDLVKLGCKPEALVGIKRFVFGESRKAVKAAKKEDEKKKD